MSGRTLSPRVTSSESSPYPPANVSVATHLNIRTSLGCGRVFVVAVFGLPAAVVSRLLRWWPGLEKLIRSICTSQWMYTFKVADYVFKLLLICFRATKLCARHVNYKSFAERGTWTELACQIRRLLQFTLTPSLVVLFICLSYAATAAAAWRTGFCPCAPLVNMNLLWGECLCGCEGGHCLRQHQQQRKNRIKFLILIMNRHELTPPPPS